MTPSSTCAGSWAPRIPPGRMRERSAPSSGRMFRTTLSMHPTPRRMPNGRWPSSSAGRPDPRPTIEPPAPFPSDYVDVPGLRAYDRRSSMKVLEIDLQSLPPGRSSLETEVATDELDLAEEQYRFGDPVRVLLDVVKNDEEIVFHGTTLAPATIECSRCLTRFENVVEVPFSLIAHRVGVDSPMLRGGEEEEGIRFIPRSATSVQLRDEVRAALILALPINPVCREDCKGLCPKCGSDLNAGDCGCSRKTSDWRWGAVDARRQD